MLKKEVSKGANSNFLFRNLCDKKALDITQQTQIKFNARHKKKHKGWNVLEPAQKSQEIWDLLPALPQ